MRKQQLDGAPAVPLFFFGHLSSSAWVTLGYSGREKGGDLSTGRSGAGGANRSKESFGKIRKPGSLVVFFWSRKQQLDGAHIVPLFFPLVRRMSPKWQL